MTKLNEFMNILTGEFDNTSQYERLKQSDESFPFAKHINTICNNKFVNLPEEFNGLFMIEESYYLVNNQSKAMPHLFLFTQDGDQIILTSYDIPKEYDNQTFTYQNINEIDYNTLQASTKFTPATYKELDGVWSGGSISMFTPVLKFTLQEQFSNESLVVSETMEANGKLVFGFSEPIIYHRI